MKTIIKDIAELEYSLFVVNTHAAGVQGDKGIYYTKYFPITPYVLANMIKNGGSLGCYQQVYCSDRIRWICLDFDCVKGTAVDLNGLYMECVLPVTTYLDSIGIQYLQEYSGRRGIHVWIVFSSLITKLQGYEIITAIIDAVPKLKDSLKSEKWGLDRFPANGLSKKNKVGKQVKFPLSCHTMGGRSFFFDAALLSELKSNLTNCKLV